MRSKLEFCIINNKLNIHTVYNLLVYPPIFEASETCLEIKKMPTARKRVWEMNLVSYTSLNKPIKEF